MRLNILISSKEASKVSKAMENEITSSPDKVQVEKVITKNNMQASIVEG